ncbi:hypothetical protein [Clostridium magnum]|uniref:hypothetical protein n=1 Tax=Clostridium magnum TaxID=33954 RepID=UPI000919B569|nr:hypothetical protein [Clostridium magnum]SHJ28782.1 hypothetical protein SAMN02745944_05692 [Clostridium magnum DSM 2767]
MKRVDWHTTFDQELKKEVGKTAIDLGTTPNMILEIAYIYLKTNCNPDEAKRILEQRKTALRQQSGNI